jgi:YHS domain-containing protein
MNMIRKLSAAALCASILAAPLATLAADRKNPPQPDKLTTCPVSGDKLGEMDKPFVFEYQGQEVKLCCKKCKKDFDKDPAKYLKLIRAADQGKVKEKEAKN